jgi:hypothetical protein
MLKHRSLETGINLSADLYVISPAKIFHFKPIDPFIFYTKTMFSIWGDTVQKFIRVSSDLWLKYLFRNTGSPRYPSRLVPVKFERRVKLGYDELG